MSDMFVHPQMPPRSDLTSASVYEWVEIVEPETRKLMYANVATGDCRWEAPQDVNMFVVLV